MIDESAIFNRAITQAAISLSLVVQQVHSAKPTETEENQRHRKTTAHHAVIPFIPQRSYH